MCQSRLEQVDLYQVLGIPASAQSSEVSTAYRRAALRTHPDKGGSAEAFHLTALAFEILSCPVTRNLYDEQRNHLKKHQHEFNSSFPHVFLPHRVSEHTAPFRQAGSKRQRSDSDTDFEHVASKRRSRNNLVANKARSWQALVDEALTNLQGVLHSMDAELRRRTIPKLPSRVRYALVSFMEKQPQAPAPKQSPSRIFGLSSSTLGGVRLIRNSRFTKYQAKIRMKDLRLYTREQSDLDATVEHQILLARLRHEIATETALKPEVWLEPQPLVDKCSEILSQHGVTEEGLGLRAFLEFRASPWCGSGCTISSPVCKSLQEALQLNARLLKARSTSWEALRSEWIQLLMIPRRGQPKRLSLKEAEAIADTARNDTLRRQLERVVRSVEAALARKAQKMMRARKTEKKRTWRKRVLFWKERRRQDRHEV